jgi:cell division septation protein DedD
MRTSTDAVPAATSVVPAESPSNPAAAEPATTLPAAPGTPSSQGAAPAAAVSQPDTPAPSRPAPGGTAIAAAHPASYHVTIAAFKTEQRASAVAAQLRERGVPTYTRLDASSEWRLVLAGPFASTADAAAAQRTLAAQGFPDTRVFAGE